MSRTLVASRPAIARKRDNMEKYDRKDNHSICNIWWQWYGLMN